jgi:hypothetical protein
LGGRQRSGRSSRYVDPLVPRGTRTGRPSVSSLTRLLQTHNNTHVEPQSPSSLSEPCYLTIKSLSAFTIEALLSEIPLLHKHDDNNQNDDPIQLRPDCRPDRPHSWIKWIAQLENKCVPLCVWHLFDTKQLSQPLVKPRAITRPEIDGYQPSAAAINAHTTQYQLDHPLATTIPPFVPACISDLSNTGKASYKEDVEDFKGRFEAYKMKDTEFQRESNHLAQVTDFIRTTVSAHLFSNCCKPSQPYRDWITKLAATVGVRAEDELDKARTRYHEAMKPMRVVTQWDTWLTEVNHAVTKGRATGVPECLNDQFIKKDFVSSVSKHFSTWTTSFIVHGLCDATVTAMEMFLQLRQNAKLMHPTKSRSNKAAFAAGGPTLNDKEPDNEKNRGRGRNAQKRQHPYGGGSSSSQRCKACDGFHTLSKCWYAFSDTAPENWQPRDHITKMVKDRISNTHDLQDDVQSTKRARSKTPVIEKSQSSTPTVEPTSEE